MRFSKLFFSILMCVLILGSTNAFSQAREVNWEAFSINLVKAIKSGHPGLQQSAMQHIIKYGDLLDVEEAVYDIAQILRFDDDKQVRRLAMVTLYKIHSDKAMRLLSENIKYEDCDSMKKQCCTIIKTYLASRDKKEEVDLSVSLNE